MILAVTAMSPTVRLIFFAVALVLFLVAAFGQSLGRVSPLALGLASFTVPFAWDATAAT